MAMRTFALAIASLLFLTSAAPASVAKQRKELVKALQTGETAAGLSEPLDRA